jgi:tetratricopeptide (TPR) repeat protein
MLAGAAGLGGWVVLGAPATNLDRGPARLLVLAFTNETGDPSLNALGRIAADWLSQGIAKTGLVRVMPPGFEPADSQDAGAHLTRVRALAASARADLVIWGSYYWSGDSLQIQADLADLHRSEPLLALGSVRTGSHSPMPAIEVLRQKTLAVLASQLDPRLAAAAAVQSTPPSYEAYQEFSEGLDYWYRREGPDALPHFMRAYALDSTYTLPLIYAIDVHRGSGRPMMVDSLVRMLIPRRAELAPYDRAVLDLHAAASPAAKYLAARAAAAIAPGSPIAANDLPMLAVMLNRPAEALEHLARIDTDRGEGSRLPVYWARLSAATHLLGKYERQLEIGVQVRRRFPTDNRSYYYTARALAAMGRLAELDAVLGESLQLEANAHWGSSALPLHALAFDELTAHGYPEHALVVLERAVEFFEKAPAALQKLALHRFELARVLYRLGRFDESRRLLEQVLAEGGTLGASEALIRGEIGIVAAHQGDLATVERMDQWLTETAAPHLNGRNTEYRAKFAAVLGRKAEAVRLLQQSSSEGYGFGLERHQAPEYQGLRGYRPFDEFLRPKG